MWQEPGLSVAWEKIREQAKQVEWCRLLGPKARNYTRGKSLLPKKIPFEIDQTARKTFVAAETSDLAIVTGIPGGDKRFGTLQVNMHSDPDFVQPRLGYLLACLRTLVIF